MKIQYTYELDSKLITFCNLLANLEAVVNKELRLEPNGKNYFYYLMFRLILDNALMMSATRESFGEEDYKKWIDTETNIFMSHMFYEDDPSLVGLDVKLVEIVNKYSEELYISFLDYGYSFHQEYDHVNSNGCIFTINLKYT